MPRRLAHDSLSLSLIHVKYDGLKMFIFPHCFPLNIQAHINLERKKVMKKESKKKARRFHFSGYCATTIDD